MAAILNLTAFTQAHKPVARPSLTIAGGTEAGNISHLHQPAHYLVQRAFIADVELLGAFVLRFGFAVAAHAGARGAADL